MTVSQVVFIGVVTVLFLNTAVYGLRIQFLLLANRAEPALSIVIGWTVWQRIATGRCDGLDEKNAGLFLALRRSFLVSMAACFIAMGLLAWRF